MPEKKPSRYATARQYQAAQKRAAEAYERGDVAGALGASTGAVPGAAVGAFQDFILGPSGQVADAVGSFFGGLVGSSPSSAKPAAKQKTQAAGPNVSGGVGAPRQGKAALPARPRSLQELLDQTGAAILGNQERVSLNQLRTLKGIAAPAGSPVVGKDAVYAQGLQNLDALFQVEHGAAGDRATKAEQQQARLEALMQRQQRVQNLLGNVDAVTQLLNNQQEE